MQRGGGAEVFAAAEAGIASVIDVAVRGADDEGRPQAEVAVAQTARRPMLRGLQYGLNALAEPDALLPIAFVYFYLGILFGDEVGVVERYEIADARLRGVQAADGGEVEVVVVIVRYQYPVDGWKIGDVDARGVDALGAGKAKGAGAFRPMRVEQDVYACGLDEHGGVADEAQTELLARDALRGIVAQAVGGLAVPSAAFAVKAPLQDIPEGLAVVDAPRVEEAFAVEVVAGGQLWARAVGAAAGRQGGYGG